MKTKKIFLILGIVLCAVCMLCTACSGGGGGGGTAFLKSLFATVDGVWLPKTVEETDTISTGLYLIDGYACLCYGDEDTVTYSAKNPGTYSISGSTVTIKIDKETLECKWSDDTLTYKVDDEEKTLKRYSPKINCIEY